MNYRFEKMNVWIETRGFIKDIYVVVNKFPKNEQYVLGNQIRRAAISIALNIVEGSAKNSDKDFTRYLRISLGSLHEVVAGLYLAKDLKYLNEKDFQNLYDTTHKLSAMILAFIRKLNEK
ncbi:MAG: four helix bundle protein [Candidatus Berkelbacteria bacterium]|nr:four helix bundle protein [Candidatus Berkelbacteria bacterium]